MRTCILGLITTAGGAIGGLKYYQIHAYQNFVPNILDAKISYYEMDTICHKNKFLTPSQKEKFTKSKNDFDRDIKNIFQSDLYSLKRPLFGKDISKRQSEITDELMNIDAILTDCSNLKTINTVSLYTKETDVAVDMIWAIGFRWFPVL